MPTKREIKFYFTKKCVTYAKNEQKYSPSYKKPLQQAITHLYCINHILIEK